jgi:hypothetical protein
MQHTPSGALDTSHSNRIARIVSSNYDAGQGLREKQAAHAGSTGEFPESPP